MRVLRLFFTIVTILLLIPSFLFSQSSIYQDAKELAKIVDDPSTVTVHLKKGFNSEATITLSKSKSVYEEEVKLKSNSPDSFVFSDYGSFKIEVEKWGNRDTILVSFKDSLFASISKNKVETINMNNDGTVLSSSSDSISWIDVINDWDGVYIFQIFESQSDDYSNAYANYDNYDMLNTRSPYKKILKSDEKEAIAKTINILNSQTNFNNIEKQNEISISFLKSEYAPNPFLNNFNTNNLLFSPSFENYFFYDFFEKIGENFPQYYYKNNPWHKLLYGDSILNFQKTVSFKDASISYRKQITTSQNELTDASVRINQTSRNKGFLDAKTVAVGLSDFIAERAQEELNLTFFNRFKENLKNPSELTVLFPNTKTLLYNFEISNYKTLLSHARESFQVDLDNLGLNFPKILKASSII
ncbi:MAG: hypothetical protein AB8F94_13660, partial [Saprospiraceae bacterium]